MPAIDFRNLEAEVGVTPTGRTPLEIPVFGPSPGTVLETGPGNATLEDIVAYYSSGFLPAGGGQIGGGSLLDRITGIASGVLQTLTAPRPSVFTPPIVPMSALPAPIARTAATAIERGMGAVIKTAEEHPVLTAAGGAAATAAGGVMGVRTMRGRKRPTVVSHPDGRVTVHHRRRMNACNIHALRRALRRAHSFERIARRVLHFTSPGKAHGVAHFKKARRRRRIA